MYSCPLDVKSWTKPMVSMRFIAPELTVKELTDALVTGTENGAGKLKAAGAERMKFCDQTFEGRREALGQANKLSRTYAALLDALNRHRGKGQHDAFEDALGAAEMYLLLEDMRERGVRLPRKRSEMQGNFSIA
jgi:hypothetical protein